MKLRVEIPPHSKIRPRMGETGEICQGGVDNGDSVVEAELADICQRGLVNVVNLRVCPAGNCKATNLEARLIGPASQPQ